MVKLCKKCNQELPIEDFYKHAAMLDGRLNFCKSCVKARVGEHREKNLEAIRAYDRERGRTEARLVRVRENQRNMPESHRIANEKWGASNPEKKRAHGIVSRAIRSGVLVRQPCFCGSTAEAHHPDYSKPLDVIWLCSKHHREIHRRYDSERNFRIEVGNVIVGNLGTS